MLRTKRNYVVLVKGSDGRWTQFTAIYTSTKRAALDQATATGYTAGTFRVVTAKAWNPEYEL